MNPNPKLADARLLCDAATGLIELAIDRARDVTESGKRIDDHQVLTERVAYAATQARAAAELIAAVEASESRGIAETTCAAAVADLTRSLIGRLEPALADLELDEADFERSFSVETKAVLRATGHDSVFRAIGRHCAETRGRNDWPLDELHDQVRGAVREFGEKEVAPAAERIHRNDELVPESFIREMAELGYFGLAIPEQYGGSEMGNLAMILTTEELSRASLAAAGSLITRPEILTKALVQGGTEEQKAQWLPKIAAGEIMVGISVTEPDVGSDVASVKCRAEAVRADGADAVAIHCPKAGCH